MKLTGPCWKLGPYNLSNLFVRLSFCEPMHITFPTCLLFGLVNNVKTPHNVLQYMAITHRDGTLSDLGAKGQCLRLYLKC